MKLFFCSFKDVIVDATSVWNIEILSIVVLVVSIPVFFIMLPLLCCLESFNKNSGLERDIKYFNSEKERQKKCVELCVPLLTLSQS